MNKIRKWFKPKKEVEKELMSQPLTPEVTIVMETLNSTPQTSPILDLRDLTRDLISQTRTDRSDPDLTLTRLSMLRELLQGHISQKEEVSDVQQHCCREHLRTATTTTTTTMSALSPQISAPFPVWRSVLQVEQITGNKMELTDTGSSAIISPSSAEGRRTDTSASSPGLPVRPFLQLRDNCSLPSSPHPGGRRRLPCSLPCSPLLGGRHWRSLASSPSPPSGLSRLWVEAALQRSKNIRQTEPQTPPPCSPEVRQEGQEEQMRGGWGKTEEEGEEWSDEEKEEDKQMNTVDIVGIRLSDTIIFRPMTSPSLCEERREEEAEEEEEEKDSDLLCLVSEMSRYCLLSPCICFRCPSAPPYEAEVFSAGDIQTVSSFSSNNQKEKEGLNQLSHRADIQRSNKQKTDIQRSEGCSQQSLPVDRAPQLSESSRLYPSLSLWRITADSQTELNRKQEEEVNSFRSQLNHNTIQSCVHSNNDDHLQRLCEMISGVPGDLQTLCSAALSFILKKVFDSTTCSKRTAHTVESCSFCSDKLSVQLMKHFCRNCAQVFCSRCLCHFVSLLQIHQFSQAAAV